MATARSPRRTDWATPQAFYERLSTAVGGFAIDAAANAGNHKEPVWYGPDGIYEDALAIEQWLSPAFCNPPYLSGAERDRWLAKFKQQVTLGVTVVTILPAATGSQWWKAHVVDPDCDIMFVSGRLKFSLPDRTRPSQPNHDSAVVIYAPDARLRVGWIDARPTT